MTNNPYDALLARLNTFGFCKACITTVDGREMVWVKELAGYYDDQFWIWQHDDGSWHVDDVFTQPMLQLTPYQYVQLRGAVLKETGEKMPALAEWADACVRMGRYEKYTVWVDAKDGVPTNAKAVEAMEVS